MLLCALLSSFHSPYATNAWDDETTHKTLTEQAVRQFVVRCAGDVFTRIGISNAEKEILLWEGRVCNEETGKTNCTVTDWLKYGAEKEDESNLSSQRFNNHFHDPLSGSGIDDYAFGIYHVTGQSCLEWAQDYAAQSGQIEGDQSWSTIRGLFYLALTHSDEDVREETFAQMFKGLGHRMGNF